MAWLAIAAWNCAARADWQVLPTVTLGVGHEDGMTVDPAATRATLPGGSFLNAGSVVEVVHPSGNASQVRLTAQGSFERFFDDVHRQLKSASVTAELRARPGGPWRARVEGTGGWFDDSAVTTAQRWDAATEGALGVAAGRWLLEAMAGARGRRHPDLQVVDASGTVGTYTESGLSSGGAMLVQLSDRAFLRAEATRVWTDSGDPEFDSSSNVLRAAAQVRLTAAIRMRAAGVVEHRDFQLAGVGHDDYAQVGGALDAVLRDRLEVSARWALARYQSPTGVDEDTQRVELGCIIRLGKPAAILAREQRRAFDDTRGISHEPTEARAGVPYLFRVHAPGASSVAVVGDFNHWNADADALQPVGDAFWELRRALPAGTWQYAYLVDGRSVAPPEAWDVVDDGFGGRNAILVVLP